MNRPIIIGVLTLGLIGALIAAFLVNQRAEAQTDECTPAGGLRCVAGHVYVCQGGQLEDAGPCPGGCEDKDGIVRCTNEAGTLLAPTGAGCQRGMALCGVEAASLMVCRDGSLTKGADCPGGCEEAGEQGGLYCYDEPRDSIRFAEDFPCPDFNRGVEEFTCGSDGTSLLVCREGLLIKHDVTCAECKQTKYGALSCLTADGTRVDPATGRTANR